LESRKKYLSMGFQKHEGNYYWSCSMCRVKLQGHGGFQKLRGLIGMSNCKALVGERYYETYY
jgi:hypothetical protein